MGGSALWQQVRPRLGGRTRGWGLWFQALLGSILVSLALFLLLLGICAMAGVRIYPLSLLGVSLFLIGIPPFWFILSLVTGLEEGVPFICVGLPLLTNHLFWLGQLTGEGEIANTYWGIMALGAASMGLGAGLVVGLKHEPRTLLFAMPGMVIFMALSDPDNMAFLSYMGRVMIGLIWGGLWFHLGAFWVTRNKPSPQIESDSQP